jgi:hypothetical protein
MPFCTLLGNDPAAGKREAREALSVAGLVEAYIDAGEGRRSAATNGDYRRTLKAALQGSPIGPQPAQQLARVELRAFLEGIAPQDANPREPGPRPRPRRLAVGPPRGAHRGIRPPPVRECPGFRRCYH